MVLLQKRKMAHATCAAKETRGSIYSVAMLPQRLKRSLLNTSRVTPVNTSTPQPRSNDGNQGNEISAQTIREQVDRALTAAANNDGVIPIVTAGDPVLRTTTARFDGQIDDATLLELLTAMRTTMLAAPGVGLAAPQIGISLRLAVCEDPGTTSAEHATARERTPLPFTALINPTYKPATDQLVAFYEGCLSIPGYQAVVARPRTIALTAHDHQGATITKAVTGWAARIIAHESDHLDGILYLDKAEMRSLATHEQVARWWNQPTAQQAAAALGFELPAPPAL